MARLEVSQAIAYTETEQQRLKIEQAIALVEVQGERMSISQAICYVEVQDPYPFNPYGPKIQII